MLLNPTLPNCCCKQSTWQQLIAADTEFNEIYDRRLEEDAAAAAPAASSVRDTVDAKKSNTVTVKLLSSCMGADSKAKVITPEKAGMFSFVNKAPDGRPIKAALVGCGDRVTGAATQFLKSGTQLSIIAPADVFPDRMEQCRKIFKCRFHIIRL